MAICGDKITQSKGLGILAAIALSASVIGATPAAAFTEYLGGGFVVVSDSCNEFGWSGTHQVLVRMEPQGMPGNADEETQIAILLNTGTVAMRLNIDSGRNATYPMLAATYVWNGPWSPEEPTMQIRFDPDAQWPLTAGSLMDRFSVTIDNFNEHLGCVAWLNASLARN